MRGNALVLSYLKMLLFYLMFIIAISYIISKYIQVLYVTKILLDTVEFFTFDITFLFPTPLFILLLMLFNRSLANCSWFMDTFSLISLWILIISFNFVVNSLFAFSQGVLSCLFALVSDFSIRDLSQDLVVHS